MHSFKKSSKFEIRNSKFHYTNHTSFPLYAISSLLSPAGIISILIALSVHEWAHAYSAYKLGDPTAKNEGRLTLNPISHLDPLGTILFILVGFGWGKPVPIDPRYFKHVNRDSAIVAAAGPFSNLVLAWLFAFILAALGANFGTSIGTLVQSSVANSAAMQFAIEVCKTSIYINLILMAFNLLPIAPLDGSKILRLFIPYQYEDVYNDLMARGPMILLGLLILDRVLPIPLLSSWIFIIINPIIALMSAVMNAI